ncbi:MAG TPA: hypothetical protein PKG60_01180 [Spirochaetota bacterium]|nr:hypothetical protein [Spirochaetota bacterium]
MKLKLPVILLFLMFTACSTMPPEIEDKYLAEKTEPQSKTIFALEQRIIDKNKEKQAVEKKTKEQAKLPAGTEDEIKLLEKENDIIKDQVYLYEKNKDAVNLEVKKSQLTENESKLAKKKALLQFHQSEKKLFDTELELKNAELAQYIAELNVEKSKIAAAYRDKNEQVKPEEEGNFFTKLTGKFSKKDPDDKYGYKQHAEYLEKKKQETSKTETDFREAERKFLDAKLTLDKTK